LRFDYAQREGVEAWKKSILPICVHLRPTTVFHARFDYAQHENVNRRDEASLRPDHDDAHLARMSQDPFAR
jgi:hypothetical protein